MQRCEANSQQLWGAWGDTPFRVDWCFSVAAHFCRRGLSGSGPRWMVPPSSRIWQPGGRTAAWFSTYPPRDDWLEARVVALD